MSYSLRKQKEVLHDRNSENSDRLLATTMIHEEEEGGQILLFSVRDLYHWKFEKKLAVNGYRIGRMWECPDLFELDGKQVILASAMDMLPDGLEYHNGNGTFCLIGEYDRETGRFVPEADQSVDYGIDFYAEPRHGILKLRIILDRFSAEVFVNGGKKVMTITFYTDVRADGISFYVDGEAEFSVTKYRLQE